MDPRLNVIKKLARPKLITLVILLVVFFSFSSLFLPLVVSWRFRLFLAVPMDIVLLLAAHFWPRSTFSLPPPAVDSPAQLGKVRT